MIFNERLKELRKEKGLTQMEAARALGVNYRHYQRLEADGNTPNFSNLVQIADLFDVSMDYLAGRTGRREVNREMRHTVPGWRSGWSRSLPPPCPRRGWACPVKSTC